MNKVISVVVSQETFDKLAVLAHKNRRSVRAESAIILEEKVRSGKK